MRSKRTKIRFRVKPEFLIALRKSLLTIEKKPFKQQKNKSRVLRETTSVQLFGTTSSKKIKEEAYEAAEKEILDGK